MEDNHMLNRFILEKISNHQISSYQNIDSTLLSFGYHLHKPHQSGLTLICQAKAHAAHAMPLNFAAITGNAWANLLKSD